MGFTDTPHGSCRSPHQKGPQPFSAKTATQPGPGAAPKEGSQGSGQLLEFLFLFLRCPLVGPTLQRGLLFNSSSLKVSLTFHPSNENK